MNTRQQSSTNGNAARPEQRPPILLTTADRDKLLTLVRKAPAAAAFLHEEVERAEIATGDVASTSLVRMGSEVKFIDHGTGSIHRVKLVFPEEEREPRCISVLSSLGSALIGLGPGQSIRWTERGRERSLSVLEVHAEEGASPRLPEAHPSALALVTDRK